VSGLTLHLLGPPLLVVDGRSVGNLRRKAMALIAYLAVDRHPHSRDALATLFWPEYGQSRARANLRRCLFDVNEAVGHGVLTSDQDTLNLGSENLMTDVDEFRRLAAGCGMHDREKPCETCSTMLRQAEELYSNDFLFGFTLPDCTYFDEWQLLQGERLRIELADVLDRLIRLWEQEGAASEALGYARRLLALDPLEESSHRILIRLSALAGQRAAAIRQYDRCVKLLKDELDAEPDPSTIELVHSIRERTFVKGDSTPLRIPASDEYSTAGTLPVQLHQRDAEAFLVAAYANGCAAAALVRAIDTAGGTVLERCEGMLSAKLPDVGAAIEAAIDFERDNGAPLHIAIHVARADAPMDRLMALLSACPDGEILLSSTAADRAHERLPRGVSLRSLEYHRLIDLGPPEQIFQVIHPEHIRQLPILETVDSRPNNLPEVTGRFIGRDDEIAEIEELIVSGTAQLITLTGPAGTGKTRLSLQAAARLIHHFDDGAFFVDLGSVRDARSVPAAICSALALHAPSGIASSEDRTLTDFLRGRRMLLLLDNFEHLIQAATWVSTLAAAAPGVKFVVTSRQRLGIRAEREYCVSPLTVPDCDAPSASLLATDSVRLFFDRARAVVPEIEANDATVQIAARICTRLDGLPLAIELAAARLKIFTPPELLHMLGDRFAVLTAGPRDLPERQQTLKSAVDWSYDLLDAHEKRVFTLFAVFSGGCTLEAAESVCTDTADPEAPDVLSAIASLVDKSLLRSVDAGGEKRFSFFETIREYAALMLREHPDENSARKRHAEFYRTMAIEAETQLHSADQIAWLDQLEREHENIRQALRWLMDSGMSENAVAMATALEWFWYRYGHVREANQWLTETVHADRHDGSPSEQASEGRALRCLAWFQLVGGAWEQSRETYEVALKIARASGDRKNETLALSGLGAVERWIGNHTEGRAHTNASVSLSRSLRDPLLITLSLIWAHATRGGKYDGTPPVAELDEALQLARRLGDLWCEAHAHDGLGDLFAEMGRPEDALPHYQQALDGFRILKDRWLMAWTLQGLCRVHLLNRDAESACACIRESIGHFSELGDRTNTIAMLGWLGRAFLSSGKLNDAATVLGAFLSLEKTTIDGTVHSEPNTEFSLACKKARATAPGAWISGEAMTYDQIVVHVTGRHRYDADPPNLPGKRT